MTTVQVIADCTAKRITERGRSILQISSGDIISDVTSIVPSPDGTTYNLKTQEGWFNEIPGNCLRAILVLPPGKADIQPSVLEGIE